MKIVEGERILKSLDVFQCASDDQAYCYRLLEDIKTNEFSIVQCDTSYSDFNDGIHRSRQVYFQDLLMANWDDRVFYPSIEAAMLAFFE